MKYHVISDWQMAFSSCSKLLDSVKRVWAIRSQSAAAGSCRGIAKLVRQPVPLCHTVPYCATSARGIPSQHHLKHQPSTYWDSMETSPMGMSWGFEGRMEISSLSLETSPIDGGCGLWNHVLGGPNGGSDWYLWILQSIVLQQKRIHLHRLERKAFQ